MRKPRAHTLIEALVSMSIFSIATLAIFQLMIFGMQTYRHSDQTSDGQRALMRISQQLKRECGQCLASTVTFHQAGPSDLVLSAASLINDIGVVEQEPTFQVPQVRRRLFYFRDAASSGLKRAVVSENVSFLEVSPLTEINLVAAVASSPGTVQLNDCLAFAAVDPDTAAITSSVYNPMTLMVRVLGPNQQTLEFRTVVKFL